MTMTYTGQVARHIMRFHKVGTIAFNDRLVDGRRSLKVWQWRKKDYELAQSMLTMVGCEAVIVPRRDGGWRLHVKEPS